MTEDNNVEMPEALRKPNAEQEKAIKAMEERLKAKRDAQASQTPAEQQKAKEEAPQIQQAEFAFIVIKNKDGSFAISPNLNLPVTVDRTPTNDDVWQAFHNILKDLQIQQTAQIAGQVAAQAALQAFQQMSQQAMNGGPDVDKVLQEVANRRV